MNPTSIFWDIELFNIVVRLWGVCVARMHPTFVVARHVGSHRKKKNMFGHFMMTSEGLLVLQVKRTYQQNILLLPKVTIKQIYLRMKILQFTVLKV